jgi:hypothetical protein
MGLTKAQAAEKTIARLIEKGEKADGLLKPDIISWIDEALQRLARRISDGPDYRELQKELSQTITSGSTTISDTSVIIDSLPSTGLILIGSPTTLSIVLVAGSPVVTAPPGTFLSTDLGLALSAPSCSGSPIGNILSFQSSSQITMDINNACGNQSYNNASLTRTFVAKWKPRYDSLLQSNLASDIFHYAIRGNKLYFRNPIGALVFSGSATVLVNFVPTLGTSTASDLPVRFENQLIDTLVEMSFEKQKRNPPPLLGDNS